MFNSFNHLKVDLKRTTEQLVVEAIVLLLRHHGLGDGLPEPMAPVKGGAP